MSPEDSPFTPNQPVSADFFTGREAQVHEIIAVVRKAAARNLQIAWITGERGIGKSSIASFVGGVAERDYAAMVAHVHLGGVANLQEMVKQSYLGLLKDNQRKAWGGKLLAIFGERVKKVGFLGFDIELNFSNHELSVTAQNFAQSLNDVIERSGTDRKVLVLILDDINGLANDPQFAHWLKSMVDSVATSQTKIPVCLLFVGLEERLNAMRKNNPSVIRSFNEIVEIKPWEKSESINFFKSAFGKKGVQLPDESINLLADFSGGIPTIAHEIGDHVWRVVENGAVEEGHIAVGIRNAAYSIGQRFIEKEVVQALGSKNYKSILKKIGSAPAQKIDTTFSKEDLLSLKTFTDAEKKSLGNFLRRMINVGGIIPVERGVYRFPTEMHRFYLFLAYKQPTK